MTRELRLTLPPEPASARRGREIARRTLADWDLTELTDDVALGATELVTNAIRHARTEILLTMTLDTQLTVSVRDGQPALRQPVGGALVDPYATSGRGLHLVAAISADWGVTSVDGGKVVWFTLDLPGSGTRDADVFDLDDRRHDGASDSGDGEPGVAI